MSGEVDFDPSNMDGNKFLFRSPLKNMVSTNKEWEKELKSAHCFNAEKYPELIFQSDSLMQDNAGGIVYQLYGKLTAGGTTKQVKIQIAVTPNDDGFFFRGTFSLNLKNFGMRNMYSRENNLEFFMELRTTNDK